MTPQAARLRAFVRAGAHIFILAVAGAGTVHAQGSVAPVAAVSAAEPPAGAGGMALDLLVGRSVVVDIGRPIARVSLTSAEIADALVTSSSQLLVNGKSPGTISMFVWERGGEVRRYQIAVQRDLATLDRQLAELFPGERLQAQSSGRQIILSGSVTSKDVVERAVNVAAGFVEKRDEVISLLQVQATPRSNQVLLRVRFAEVSRSALTELGLSLFTSPLGVNNTLGRITTQQFPSAGFDDLKWSKESSDFGAPVTDASGKFTFSDFLNFFVLSERYDLGLLVRALQTRGLFQSLAEPNLVAESGKEASFLAGGEFPIPIAQGSGANIGVSVVFKEFGIRLSFTPTVNGDRVHLKVRPEVSMLDFNNAVVLGGFRIPALTTRRTETELELQSGQTFAIAGLMNNTMNTTLQKIPGIGDIPILGYLFRSKAAQKEQTELVVIITPQILPTNSPGVTPQLPRMPEPFLPRLQEEDTLPAPPPAFGAAPSGVVAPAPAVERVRTERDARGEAQARKEARDRQKAEERARSAAEKARAKQAAEAGRAARAERERQEKLARAERERQATLAREQATAARAREKLAREQAKRDAEAARRAAAEQKRQAEAERRRQQAIAAAEAKLKAAQRDYEAQVTRGGGQ